MLTVASVFSNHCVLQRNKKVRIWGEADSEKVYAKLIENGKIIDEAEDMPINGLFELNLNEHEAGGPYSLEIYNDTDKITFDDIMFGEVWLAGGQSNMELEIQNAAGWNDVKDNMDSRVRFYYTQKVAYVGEDLFKAEKNSCWETNASENRKAWSAVGYYFAERLAKEKNIPIGIIGCNWGGTSASCWVSKEALEEVEELHTYLNEYNEKTKGQKLEEYLKELKEYEVYQAEFDKNVGNYYKTNQNPTWEEAISLFGENRYPGPMGPRNWTRPCGLYESMLERVAPYTINGFIFYQGEEDDNRPYIYEKLLKALIKNWRKLFKDDKLPFYIVQLPVFRNEGEDNYGNWPFIREAQSNVADSDKNAGLAVILEAGEDRNIHPLNKKLVGERLALLAMGEFEYPKYESYNVKNSFMYLKIKNSKGLHTINKDGLWNNFEIAGEDKKYYPATVAVIPEKNDTTIRLNSTKVLNPKYARYFWKNYDVVEIFGENDTPLAPFRTSSQDGAVAYMSRQGELK